MGVLDDIARGSGINPIGAFLVGRQQRDQKRLQTQQLERQSNIDAQQSESRNIQNEFRRLQVEDLKSQPEKLAAAKAEEQQLLQAQKEAVIPQIDALDLPEPQKQLFRSALSSATTMDDFQTRFNGLRTQLVDPTQRVEQTTIDGGSAKTPSAVSKNVVDFEDAAIGAVGSFQTGLELLKLGQQSPEILGAPGSIARFGDTMIATAEGLGSMFGVDVDADRNVDSFNFEGFAGNLRQSAAESSQFRSGIYGIAFAAAVAEQGTRPTDKDIQQFIDQIAGNSSSFPAFSRTIQSFMGRVHKRIKNTANIKGIPEADRNRILPTVDSAFDEFNSFFSGEGQAGGAVDDDLTAEEQLELEQLKRQLYGGNR